jgi:hypothetical protein
MKKLTILVGLSVLFWACSKNSGPANGNSVQPNNKLDTLVTMTASINGNAYHTDSVFGYDVQPTFTDSIMDFDLLVIGTEKAKDSQSVIRFYITGFTGPGNYAINAPAVTAAWYLNGQRHFADSGMITIVSDTAYALVARFGFRADSIRVTNGYFNVLIP